MDNDSKSAPASKYLPDYRFTLRRKNDNKSQLTKLIKKYYEITRAINAETNVIQCKNS